MIDPTYANLLLVLTAIASVGAVYALSLALGGPRRLEAHTSEDDIWMTEAGIECPICGSTVEVNETVRRCPDCEWWEKRDEPISE